MNRAYLFITAQNYYGIPIAMIPELPDCFGPVLDEDGSDITATLTLAQFFEAKGFEDPIAVPSGATLRNGLVTEADRVICKTPVDRVQGADERDKAAKRLALKRRVNTIFEVEGAPWTEAYLLGGEARDYMPVVEDAD